MKILLNLKNKIIIILIILISAQVVNADSHNIYEVLEIIKKDLKTSIEIFEKNLGYSPSIFSYPFGEYSSSLKKIVKDLNFEFAFGQHSGVIDPTKDHHELPRFPINEKYGELKRFKSVLNTLPFPYKTITPENRYIQKNENPPNVKLIFLKTY